MNTKICKSCLKEFPLENFYKSRKKGYYQARCKPCCIVDAVIYQKNNVSKKTVYSRKFRTKYKNSSKLKSQQILDGMRMRSRKKGFPEPKFSRLEIEEIIKNGSCCKTGIKFEFDQSKFFKSPWTPVPDRIDSKLPYTKENTQWVCHMYNSMKQEYTEKEIGIFLDSISKFRKISEGNF